MTALITLNNVAVRYPSPAGHRHQDYSVFEGINLALRRGERLGVVGRNGVGKSTLLRCFNRMNDKWPKAYMRLASVYIALGEHDSRHGHSNDACQALQTVIRLDPSDSKARRILMAEMRRSNTSRTAPSSGPSTTSSANNPNNSRTFSYEDVDVDVDNDVDSTDATPNNSNYRNIQEAFVDKVLRKLRNLRQQYENLSDDGQAAVQVCAALLLLYISLVVVCRTWYGALLMLILGCPA